jgi:hypothetical protein
MTAVSYAHAKQFKRANRALKTLKTYLGRVTRDITRKIAGDGWLEEMVFGRILSLARRVREQTQRQRGPQGLLAARPGGGVHRQGQGAPALRVRRQGLHLGPIKPGASGTRFVKDRAPVRW